MKRLVLLTMVLALAACEGPPVEATPVDGVTAIQEPLTLASPSVVMGVHFRMHFTYNPTADTDLRVTSGPMEVSPPAYPPVSIANHYPNAWHGFSDIASFSPVNRVSFSVWGQDPNNPSGPWLLWISAKANCTISLAPYASFIVDLGVSAVDCNADVQTPILVVNQQLYVMWDPDCLNGATQSQWAYESIFGLNDSRLSYSSTTNSFTVTVSHGGPYYDRAYWQQMSTQCMPTSSSMWAHPGPWHDPIWEQIIGPAFLASDWGPFNWN